MDYFTQIINQCHEEANAHFCRECGTRTSQQLNATCGYSYCQEASYYRNKGQTGRKAHRDYWTSLANETAAKGMNR